MRQPFSSAILLSLFAAASLLSAQTTPYTVEDAFGDLPPTSSKHDGPVVPKLAFRLEAEIPLPGPLPRVAALLREGGIEIDVADGTMLVAPRSGAVPQPVEPSIRADDPRRWVEDSAGKARYRSTGGGWIEAQRRCRRCKSGWKRRWRLRVAGNTLAPPIVVDDRVYFGALDNRVYSVKAKNGHRVWVTDVGGRVSLPLVHWKSEFVGVDDGNAETLREASLILVVPDSGNRLVALLRSTGDQVAAVRTDDAGGKLIGAPLATGNGSIAVARQAYAASKASLLLYRMTEVRQEPPTSP